MQPAEPAPRRFHFNIFADYHQVYLEDCLLYDDLTENLREQPGESVEQLAARMQRLDEDNARIVSLVSSEAHARHLGVAQGTLGILTARMLEVPVTLEFRDTSPQDEWSSWDFVVEVSLELPSGCLVIHGPTDYAFDAPRVTTAPGMYRARIHYGGIASVNVYELEGDDHYRVTLWPAPFAPPNVLYAAADVEW